MFVTSVKMLIVRLTCLQWELAKGLLKVIYNFKRVLNNVKRVVMVLTSDCEEGNKQYMSKLRKEIEEVTTDPHLSLLSVLPVCPHRLKTCKGSFSNWYLELNNERGCLALLYTLWNKAEPEVRKAIKSFWKVTIMFEIVIGKTQQQCWNFVTKI